MNGIRPAIWVRYDSNSGGANSTTNLSTIADLNDNTDNIYEVQVSKEVESLSFESDASVNAVENEVSSSEDSGNKVNNVLWDNINVEGVNVYQNPDGSITIGGDAQEGAKLIQSGPDNNEIELDEKEKLDRLVEEYNNSTLKKPIDRVYYYAKHDATNKIVTSINKRNLYNGLLGLPLFSNKTYYNIEIKFNEETRKKLSKYAESEWNGAWREGKNWVLLAGDSISNLENVSWLGVSPYTETDRMVHTEGVSYYQKGKIQLNLLSENEQKRVYSKIKNAKVIILATGNVIKSYDKKIDDEEKLGNVERFEYVKDDGSHINLVNAYLDCEDKIIDYTATHLGYFLYVKDGFSGDLAYHEEIVAPKKHCSKFEILVFGNDSLSYSIYGNKVNFLAGKNVGGLKKFEVYGGKMWWEYELDTENGFEDYEKYYIENKDKW